MSRLEFLEAFTPEDEEDPADLEYPRRCESGEVDHDGSCLACGADQGTVCRSQSGQCEEPIR